MRRLPTDRHRGEDPRGFLRLDPVAAVQLALPGFSTDRIRTLQAAACWERAAGRAVARVAAVTGMSRGVLRIEVQDADWRRELDRLKPVLLRRLAEELPEARIDDLSWTVRPGGRRGARPGSDGHHAVRGAEQGGETGLDERLAGVRGRYLARSGQRSG
ncbi:MAG TPA: DciA family protein [Candidatus Polarisedimenticolia bacterium]|nr:DciA family protein [Candidatus Polarisedimenticolia bacterium]